MSIKVSTTEFEGYGGEPDKDRLIATYRGEKQTEFPILKF